VDVVLRYFFNSPIGGVLQFSEYVLLYIPFLAAAYVLKDDSHIRIDIILNRLSPKVQAALNMVTSVFGILVLLALSYYGTYITFDYYRRGVPTLKYYKIPEFLVIMVIPLGCFLFALQFIRKAYAYYRAYRENIWNGGKR
jgi:C4-dicarboxylate transporter DctQ subunit